jgi:hypothetical protein
MTDTSLPTAEQVCEQLNCLFTGNPANSDQVSGQKACVCVTCEADAIITAQAAEIERWKLHTDDLMALLEASDNNGIDMRDQLAAVKAERDAMRWQPIESAPKDGTPIDIILNGRRIPDVWWGRPNHACGEAGRYCDSCPTVDGWCDLFGYVVDKEGAESSSPTHWMFSLPAPRSPDAQGEKE